MAKINNIIRILDYNNASDLYSQIDRDLETCRADHRIYKLHTVQNISSDKALVIMEEDSDRVPIYFFYKYFSDEVWKYEELEFDDMPSGNMIMSVQELQMLKTLGENVFRWKRLYYRQNRILYRSNRRKIRQYHSKI